MPHHITSNAEVPETRGSVIRWARLYDFVTGGLGMDGRKGVVAETLDRAELRPGDRVLDVGCGPGRLAVLAKQRAGDGEVHGIDPSPEMIRVASERAANAGVEVDFRTGVIEGLPYPDASFDLVTSSFMIHHLPDDLKGKGFAEMARVLKPGGRLLVAELTGKGFLWRIMSLVGHRFPDDYGDRLAELMRDAGLTPEVLPSERRQYLFIRARKGAVGDEGVHHDDRD